MSARRRRCATLLARREISDHLGSRPRDGRSARRQCRPDSLRLRKSRTGARSRVHCRLIGVWASVAGIISAAGQKKQRRGQQADQERRAIMVIDFRDVPANTRELLLAALSASRETLHDLLVALKAGRLGEAV